MPALEAEHGRKLAVCLEAEHGRKLAVCVSRYEHIWRVGAGRWGQRDKVPASACGMVGESVIDGGMNGASGVARVAPGRS